jgi:aspartate ammonia-lyase
VYVQDTHAVNLVPAYRKQPDKMNALLPQGLMHLTDANGTDFPVRFEAFAQALTAHAPDLGQGATALLAELTAATTAKNAGLKVAKETIGSIGGQWERATQLLWQTHCTALGALWEHPEQAGLYFNYGLLPRRNAARAIARAASKPTE